MKKDFETKFTGWVFILAALMLWGGYMLSPHNVGEYLVATDFPAIGESLWTWIWVFRVHIFGWVMMIIAVIALAMIANKMPYRILITPGVGMVVVGTFTLALGSAFYYNYGAWGVGMTQGKSPEEVQAFMDSILNINQYVTCFMRFGRIFSGVGLVLLGAGMLKGRIMHSGMGWLTLLLGVVAMGIILFIPEYFEYYKPMFHVKALWLALMGVMILKNGLKVSGGE
ncbi:hypothetical protein C5O00_07005 [Pukyongia salina]|uniref:Uncharacterized protein n=1 Tax=Pukyongia salina TaxID=2094025 RepID=A0A2S0HW73_9FLAO|nr:hypothetical protein [Pukyongia salina]AVI50937.1 hypothetical protein C5O00_07005 [Pukyongia salina]